MFNLPTEAVETFIHHTHQLGPENHKMRSNQMKRRHSKKNLLQIVFTVLSIATVWRLFSVEFCDAGSVFTSNHQIIYMPSKQNMHKIERINTPTRLGLQQLLDSLEAKEKHQHNRTDSDRKSHTKNIQLENILHHLNKLQLNTNVKAKDKHAGVLVAIRKDSSKENKTPKALERVKSKRKISEVIAPVDAKTHIIHHHSKNDGHGEKEKETKGHANNNSNAHQKENPKNETHIVATKKDASKENKTLTHTPTMERVNSKRKISEAIGHIDDAKTRAQHHSESGNKEKDKKEESNSNGNKQDEKNASEGGSGSTNGGRSSQQQQQQATSNSNKRKKSPLSGSGTDTQDTDQDRQGQRVEFKLPSDRLTDDGSLIFFIYYAKCTLFVKCLCM